MADTQHFDVLVVGGGHAGAEAAAASAPACPPPTTKTSKYWLSVICSILYLPIQNEAKISPSKSSAVYLPLISPKDSLA